MTEHQNLSLDGSRLTVEDIVDIGIGNKRPALDPAAVQRCLENRRFLEKQVAAGRVIYGVNTSFGPMCNKIIDAREVDALPVNLIRSYAAGLGEPSIGVDLVEAKKELSASRPRSARLIDSVLREARSTDGPVDLSANLRQYLGGQ